MNNMIESILRLYYTFPLWSVIQSAVRTFICKTVDDFILRGGRIEPAIDCLKKINNTRLAYQLPVRQ